MEERNLNISILEYKYLFKNSTKIKETADLNLFNNENNLKKYLEKKYQLNNSIFIYKNKELKDLKFINDDYLKLTVICDKASNPVSVNNMFTNIVNSFLNNNNIINNINNIDNNNIDNNNSSINNLNNQNNNNNLENISLPQFKFDKELEELKSMGFTNTVLIKEALLITEGNLEQSINYILENI